MIASDSEVGCAAEKKNGPGRWKPRAFVCRSHFVENYSLGYEVFSSMRSRDLGS
jgi:hypothetical protein